MKTTDPTPAPLERNPHSVFDKENCPRCKATRSVFVCRGRTGETVYRVCPLCGWSEEETSKRLPFMTE